MVGRAVIGLVLLSACADTTGPGPGPDAALHTPIDLQAVTRGAQLFVAVGAIHSVSRDGDLYFLTPQSDSAVIVTSPDGITWGYADVEERAGSLADVAYGNGTYLAVGSRIWPGGLPLLLRSSTGAQWNALRDGPALEWRSIEFGNGIFLATGVEPLHRRYVVARSVDGALWENVLEIDLLQGELVFGGGTFVLFGAAGGVAYTSNGDEWSGHPLPPLNHVANISYANGRFVGSGVYDCCFGEVPEAVQYYTVLSDDGQQWSVVDRADRELMTSIAYGQDAFVAITASGLAVSHDPLAGWTETLAPETFEAEFGSSKDWFNQVIFADGRFLVIGRRNMFGSTDGRTWHRVPIPTPGE